MTVLVVGAGPAGLLTACELALAGIDTVLVERTPERPPFCRGFNLNARALDLLARRGYAEQLVAEGWQVPHAAVSGLPVTLALQGTHTDHPFTLGIPQTRVEEVLETHAIRLGVDVRRGQRLSGLTQDEDEVTATIETEHGEYRQRADYLVGCDGGRSTVRKLAGIDFPGTSSTRFTLLGDVEQADELPFGVTDGPGGTIFVIPRPGYVRLLMQDDDPPADKDTPVTLDLLQRTLDAMLGRHVPLRNPRWTTRFGDASRQASDYVKGRVILAGDAAHIHPPAGAIGVNVALDDAFNLGWKLAATVRGTDLLASYHEERHRAGERVLASTRAQVMLGDPASKPIADLLGRVAEHPDGNRALTEVITGLDARYEAFGDHPWAGRLVPDLALHTPDAETTLAKLLGPGRGVLLSLCDNDYTAPRWSDRITMITARCPDHPDLGALLVRPDGHAAWLDGTADELERALRRWFGNPSTVVSGRP
ncbi:FAD-dependent monooxygenase [Actinokineospora enzanensis]|uniref:FAD-dependent monooxygenase n=1 Tax=Actinokineospora enzanensis TaxID=155975 RepID=UPI0003759387|nr:FAD-dependent monooxygenase [Actinokineospora enzanensis]